MSSLLDETIEAVVAGLNTAIYQRPLTLQAPARQKRKTGKSIRRLLWLPSARIKFERKGARIIQNTLEQLYAITPVHVNT